jgi:phytoene desaturase
MFAVVEGMYKLAKELGVTFHFNEEAKEIIIEKNNVSQLRTSKAVYETNVLISGADYHFTENSLLAPQYRSYSEAYWEKRQMAPSCLMYYIGLNKKLKQAVHHSLFFDMSFEKHGEDIYKNPSWPSEPLFYLSVSSITDEGAAPAGQEALVLLVPVASGLKGDDEGLREKYFRMIIGRMEKHLGENIMDSIVFKKTYSVSDFVNDYNSYKGNAYGLANTLRQTAIFRPACRSKKLKNLFYTGQLTVPGPGVPPALVSGEVVAREVIKSIQ